MQSRLSSWPFESDAVVLFSELVRNTSEKGYLDKMPLYVLQGILADSSLQYRVKTIWFDDGD